MFNNQIFFAFTANPGCPSNPTSGSTRLYVAGWDLAQNAFITFVNSPYPYVYDFGKVNHTDMYWNSNNTDEAGAAIVVFNGMLYVFSDSGTYTSTDGQSWTSNPPLQGNGIQPMDAIVICPAGSGPLIMVVYGTVYTCPLGK